MNRAFTIEQLAKMCESEIKNGNGKKRILLSNDDEGNGYHELFYAFTPTDEIFLPNHSMCGLPYGVSYEDAIKRYVVLG